VAYRLLYLDEVIKDVQDAKEWYKKQHNGLETEFAIAIESALLQLLEKPAIYSIRYKNIRVAHPKRFPYNIHFYIDQANSAVVIIAIVHNKRHPKTAPKRLK